MHPITRTDPIARLGVRAAQLPAVLRALSRAVLWTPILGAALLAMAAVTAMKHSSEGYDVLMATRLTVVFIAVGAAMLLDDQAANLTGHTPSTLLYRRSSRILFGLGVSAIVWGGAVVYLTGTPRALWGGATAYGSTFPMLRFTIELLALMLAALAIATVAGRAVGEDRGGLAGGPGLLVVLLLLVRLPERWAMLTAPGGSRWAASGRDWALAAGVLAVAMVLLSLDPARRRMRARRAAT